MMVFFFQKILQHHLNMKKYKKVLVTGNNGYVGSVLSQLLIENEYNVVGLDTGYYEKCELFPSNIKIKQIKKDIRNVSSEDLSGIDAIIHLAALSNDPLCEFNPKLTYDINFKSSVKLAKLAKKTGIARFVYASSQSMYGIAKNGIVYEDSPVNPITAYAKSKIMTEQEVSK